MKIEHIVDGVITTEQKKRFYLFVIDIFTGKIEIVFDGADLKTRGICWSYYYFFRKDSGNFELLPELQRHKPKKNFFDCDGDETDEKNQFWFPMGKSEKRIKLCKKILKKL